MKVLIVDDHPIVRAGLRRLIGIGPDMSFDEAATAKEALALYKEDRPDLVIMDLNLPGTGGLEAISQLLREMNWLVSWSSAFMAILFMLYVPWRPERLAM